MELLTVPPQSSTLADDRQRALLLARREALLIELKAIEEFLGLARTVPNKRERERQAWHDRHS